MLLNLYAGWFVPPSLAMPRPPPLPLNFRLQKELEQLEMRAAGSKTKAETQRKYGW